VSLGSVDLIPKTTGAMDSASGPLLMGTGSIPSPLSADASNVSRRLKALNLKIRRKALKSRERVGRGKLLPECGPVFQYASGRTGTRAQRAQQIASKPLNSSKSKGKGCVQWSEVVNK